MNISYAEEIKARLPAREVFEFYGFPVNRGGFACCPVHQEKTPSCKVYPDSGGWHCFGCGAGSSVIDFVQLHFGLDFQASQAKLNDDFSLGLPIGQTLSRQEKIEAERRANERRKKAQARRERADAVRAAYDNALTEYASMDSVIMENAPQGREMPHNGAAAFSDEFADALRGIAGAAYRLAEAEANLFDFYAEKS